VFSTDILSLEQVFFFFELILFSSAPNVCFSVPVSIFVTFHLCFQHAYDWMLIKTWFFSV